MPGQAPRATPLTRERLRLIEHAFERAAVLPAGERDAFARSCFDGDEELTRSLLAMLAADERPPTYLGEASLASPARASAGEHVPSAAGFQTLGEVGRGGMSVVYRARQQSANREVALKVLRHAARALGGDARLRREAEFLGRLNHPSIAQVYQVGELEPPDDRAFVAMELVEGEAITDWAMDRPLRERVAMLARVARAVAHAHVRGVVHRDLKAANVLVDRSGSAKVLDFGIARLLEEEAGHTMLTLEGGLLGTPGSMAPEQLGIPVGAGGSGGGPPVVDQRADVYALGVLAYEVLAGRPPLELGGLDLPSQLRVLETARPRPLGALDPALRGDLTCIVRKAMERDPDRRYDSAGELAADLERSLASQPVTARPPTPGYLLAKFVWRHRLPVAAAAAITLTLVAAVAVSARFAAGESRRAEELERVSAFQASQLGALDTAVIGAALRRGVVEGLPPGEREAAGPAVDQVDFTQVASDLLATQVLGASRRAIDADFAADPLLRARLLQSLAETADALGLFALALEVQREALDLRLAELGEGHELTVASQAWMGRLLAVSGAFDEAEAVLGPAIAAAMAELGPDDPATLAARHALAFTFHEQDRYDDAEPIYRDVAGRRARALGEDHERTLVVRADLAGLLRGRGRAAAAEPLSRDVLERRIATLGEAHPHTLASMNNLGVLLMELDRPAEAEPLYRRALELKIQTLGRDHPSTATSLNSMAYYLYRTGKREAALPYLTEALAARRAIYGEAHPRTLVLMDNLAILLRDLGRPGEALPVAEECVRLHERVHGPNHRWTLRATVPLALSYRDLGDIDRSQAMLEELIRRAEAAGGQALRDLSWYHHELGVVLGRRGAFAEGEALLVAAYQQRREAFGHSHRNPRDTASALASFYDSWHAAEPDAGHDASAARYRELAGAQAEPGADGSGG